ncbi:MAG: type II toxin-antitoxin system VapC family toxin [Nitrospirae bacterium]|nr:type II toxin-antitoxin system VapC family toxin [Nitrospirota bacterium]
MEVMLGEILELARKERLSSYDASYLALAMRHGLPLATKDKELRKSAKRCGVEIFASRH